MSADGNCFFNALSFALFETEDMAIELRLRVALEMVINKPLYRVATDIHFQLVSPDYEDALRDCLTVGSYSSAWTMLVAANVLQVMLKISNIVTFYLQPTLDS